MPEHAPLRRVGKPQLYIMRGLMEPGGDDNEAGFRGLSGSVSKVGGDFPFSLLKMCSTSVDRAWFRTREIYVNNRELEIRNTADT